MQIWVCKIFFKTFINKILENFKFLKRDAVWKKKWNNQIFLQYFQAAEKKNKNSEFLQKKVPKNDFEKNCSFF